MLVGKSWRKKIRNVKVIPGELQHSLVVMDKNWRIFFVDEDRRRIWKEHMESIMNQENQWDGFVQWFSNFF